MGVWRGGGEGRRGKEEREGRREGGRRVREEREGRREGGRRVESGWIWDIVGACVN